MSSESGLEDLSLMDLFRSEVETHSDVLSAALLALERSPGDTSRIDEMMRAAHSIKGAARVVGVDPAVSVAHVMEDCFVAAQKGNLTLSPTDVDVLLRGVDLLGKISEATRDPNADLPTQFLEPVKTLVIELEAILVPKAKAAEPAVNVVAIPPAAGVAGSGGASVTAGGPAATISIPELLDTAAAEDVRRKFLSAVESGCDPVRIDLSATKDLDVRGLTLLAVIPRHAARLGRPRVELAGVSPEMDMVLGVTGLREAYGARPGSAREGA